MGGFSEPMEKSTVGASTLRLTNETANPDIFWDIHLATNSDGETGYTDADANIHISWYETPRGVDTLLKVVSLNGAYTLGANTTYRVQIVENKAKSKSAQGGLPLILGGAGAVDLLNGYRFTTTASDYHYPRVVSMTPPPPATAGNHHGCTEKEKEKRKIN